MPSSILARRHRLDLDKRPLSSQQLLADQVLQHSQQALSDPIALTAMGLAPYFGKLGHLVSHGGIEKIFGPSKNALAHFSRASLSRAGGFGTEIFAFEGLQRGLRVGLEGAPRSLLEWKNFKEGLLHSSINIGLLKSAGLATAKTNLVFNHFATDAAMVANHHAAASLGMMPKPSEPWLQQFIQVEAMHWRMKSGMSLFHAAAPSLRMREELLALRWKASIQSGTSYGRQESQAYPMASQDSKSPRTPQLDLLLSRLRESLEGNISEEQCRSLLEKSAERLRGQQNNPIWNKILDEVLFSDRPSGPIALAVGLGKSTATIYITIDAVRRQLYKESMKLASENASSASAPSQTIAEPIAFSAEIFDRDLGSLLFSARAKKAMQYFGLRYLGELVQKTKDELLQSPNCGRDTVKQIEETLASMGLYLGMKVENWTAKMPENGQGAAILEISPDVLALPIMELPLSFRAMRVLAQKPEIKTLGDLIQVKEADLLRIIGFGISTLKEIKEALAMKGLQLKGKDTGNGSLQDKLNTRIHDWEFSSDIQRILRWEKISYLGELVQKSERDLRAMKMRPKCIMEIIERLQRLGLRLEMTLEDWKPPTSD